VSDGSSVKLCATLCGLTFLAPLLFGQDVQSKTDFVPDSETAVKIAEAVLVPVYGKKQIESERPFTAKLKDGVWRVSGTLHCSDGAEQCFGGVAVVEISKKDARVISMGHGK
jgi:NTF2 fold immunity protein